MKGTFFLGNKKFETREMNLSALKDDEIMVKNMAAGVCGTDVHIYHGSQGSAAVTPPIVLGHEYAGEVVRVGSRVSGIRIGDKVTIDPNIYCGECHYCRLGKKQHCEHLTAIGVNRNGGFAEYSIVPAKQAFVLKDDVDYEEGAMTEPLACCLHGIDNVGIRPGDNVCVIGGGAIGLMMVQLAKISGAAMVILSEPIELRRKIGLEVGADYAVNPVAGDLKEQIDGLTGLDGVDVVIECVGKTVATDQAVRIAGRGASILLFSVPNMDAEYKLPLFDVFKKELKIQGSFINPDTHLRAVNLINEKKIKIKPLITHRFPLEEVENAILSQMSSESIKVLVKPNEAK
jgi:2-desacetyl-2-hydroxyethyl bacteriochlorophyllide A dehydrogenase